MPNQVDGSGRLLPNTDYVKISAGQTTANITVSGDATAEGRAYVSHIIVQCPTTTPGAGTCQLLDGTTVLVAHTFFANSMSDGAVTINCDVTATTTKGFGVTTPASVTCLVVGRF